MFHLPFDDFAFTLRCRFTAQTHQLQCGEHRRQRIAQLMAKHREEIVFGAVGFLGGDARLFGFEARVLRFESRGLGFRARRIGAGQLFVTLPLPGIKQIRRSHERIG